MHKALECVYGFHYRREKLSDSLLWGRRLQSHIRHL